MTPFPLRRAALAVALSAAACGSDQGTDPEIAALAGRYALQTIDGQPLPHMVSSSWILGASLTLTDDRRVVLLGRTLPAGSPGGPAPPPTFEQGVSENGTFTLSGDKLLFYTNPAHVFLHMASGVRSGSTLTVTANAGSPSAPRWHSYVYEREGS